MSETVPVLEPGQSSAFDRPLHLIQLGYLTTFDTGSTLTIGDHVGGDKRAVRLTPALLSLLSSLDPRVKDRQFDAQQRAQLRWMVGQQFVAAVRFDATPADLTMIPVARRVVRLAEILDGEGYRMCADDGAPFFLSEIGARFLMNVDGRRPMAEIMSIVGDGVLADPDGPVLVTKNEEEQGKAFDAILLEEAFEFMKATADAAAVSFEPGAPRRAA